MLFEEGGALVEVGFQELFCEVVDIRCGGVVGAGLNRLDGEARIWDLGIAGWGEAEAGADVVQPCRPWCIED